jgi:hypothetical protein
MARDIFQACPVWIYPQSNITSIILDNFWFKSAILNFEQNYYLNVYIFLYLDLKSQFLLATVFQDRPTLDHKFWCSALTN